MYFFSLLSPQQIYNMDIIMLFPFELLRKLSQKGCQHVNNRVGIWFQIYLNVTPEGPGSERVSHSLVVSSLAACSGPCEKKALDLLILSGALRSPNPRVPIKEQTMWKSIYLFSCHLNSHQHTWAHNSIIFKLYFKCRRNQVSFSTLMAGSAWWRPITLNTNALPS